MFDPALEEFMVDEITIEPYSTASVTGARTYGAAVTYKAQIVNDVDRVIDRNGRQVKSSQRILIAGRQNIDVRSRLTVVDPAGRALATPPIIAVRPVGGPLSMALDNTEILT